MVKKRLLSFLLAVLMLMSLMATGVSAATVNDTAKTAVGIARNIPYLDIVEDGQTKFYAKINLPYDGYASLTFNDESSGTEPTSYSRWNAIFYTSSLDYIVGYSIDPGTRTTYDPVGLPAGDYYVYVEAISMPETSRFQIIVNHSITGGWETELNNDWTTADTLHANEAMHGSLMESADQDCFKVDLADPGMVTFKLEHTFEGSTSSYWKLELFDANLDAMRTYDFHGNISGEETATPIGLPAGTFYVRLRSGSASTTSEYVLTMLEDTTNVGEQEFNDSFATATSIDPDVTVHGNLMTSSDKDYFRLGYMEEYMTGVQVHFQHPDVGSADGYWRVTLYNAGAEAIYSQVFTGLGSEEVVTPTIGIFGGLRYVCVEAYGNNWSDAEYTFSVTTDSDYWEQEQNDTFADASRNDISRMSNYIHGCSMTSGDKDYYRFHWLDEGLLLGFDHPVSSDPNSGWTVTLYDKSQKQLATQYFASNQPGGVLQGGIGLRSSYYYVVVSPTGSNQSTYTITLTADDGWEREENDSRDENSATALSNAPVRGNLSSGSDKDYYTFELGSPAVLTLGFDHADLQSTNSYWRIELYDAANDVTLWSKTVTGIGTGESWNPIGLAAGRYYLSVTNASSNYTSSTTYTLHALWQAADDWEQEYNTAMSRATEIQPGRLYHGSLMQSGDGDWYQFTITEPSAFDFQFGYTPVENASGKWSVTLYNANGIEMTSWSYNEKDTPSGSHIVGLNSGTYNVRVQASTHTDAVYDLMLAVPDGKWEREQNDDASWCTIMELEDLETETRYGTLMTIADKDWYRLDVPEDGYIRLDFQHPALDDAAHQYWKVELYAADKTTLMASKFYYGTADAEDAWNDIGVQGGKYYVRILDPTYNASWTYHDAGAYTFSVDFVKADYFENEENNTMTTARALRLNNAFWGNLMTSGDTDFFSFHLDDAAGVYLSFINPEDPNGGQWSVKLLADNGDEVKAWTYNAAVAGDLNPNGIGLAAGDYYIMVKTGSNWSGKVYCVQVDVSDKEWEREKNDSSAWSTQITLEDLDTVVRYGSLKTIDDKDYFAFDVPQDGHIKIEFQHPLLSDKDHQYWKLELLGTDASTVLASRIYYGTGETETAWDDIGLPAGHYYIRITDPTNNASWTYHDEGTYELKLYYASADYFEKEQNDTLETATALTIGNAMWGNLMRSDDRDWFSFSLDEPKGIYVHFFQPEDTQGYWDVSLCDSKGDAIHTWSYSATKESDFNPMAIGLPAGDYFVRVKMGNNFSSKNYGLQLNESQYTWEAEPNDTRGTATALQLDTEMNGNLRTSGDADFYKFVLDDPGAVRVNFTHPTDMDRASSRLWRVYLYNETQEITYGSQIYYGDPDRDAEAMWHGLPAGTYLVKVEPYSSSTYHTGNYAFTVETDDSRWEREVNNSFETANALPLNTDIRGVAWGETDYYQITLSKTGFVTLHFSHEVFDNTSSVWSITLYDDEFNSMTGFSSKGNTAGDLTTQGIGLAAGTYYIAVSTSSGNETSRTPYTLQAEFSTEGLWEHEKNNSYGTANPLPLNQTMHGNIMTSSDNDYYVLQISEPGYLNLEFRHAQIMNTTTYWRVYLCDAEQNYVISQDITGMKTDVKSDPLALTPGTYYVTVEHYSSSVWSDYVYELTAHFTAADNWEAEPNDATGTANPIQPNKTVNGSLMNSSDSDYFVLELPAPDSVSLAIQHAMVDSSGTVWSVYLLDENGSSKISVSSKGLTTAETRSSVTALDAGTYYVRVTGGSSSTPYALTVYTFGSNLTKITTQPGDLVGGYGTVGSFAVAATGTGLSFQWQYSINGGQTWRNTGTNSATLPRTITTANDGWLFRCVVTDQWGTTATSDSAAIILNPTELCFVTQPEPCSAAPDETVTFTAAAQGDDVIYQWERSQNGADWAPVSGATDNSLAVTASLLNSGWHFRCVATDVYGNQAVSSTAQLTVSLPALTITEQPTDFSGSVNAIATFHVTAAGEDPDYQWQYSDDAGASWKTSSSVSAVATCRITEARSGRLYRCIVTDAYGQSVTSEPAAIRVVSAITIQTQPVDYTGAVGESATFTIAATGSGLTYLWQFSDDGGLNWTNSKSTVETATCKITAARNGRLYRCVVTDQYGATLLSDEAMIVVQTATPLAITAQPQDFTGSVGESASFTVQAVGEGLSYQWQYSDNGGQSWTKSSAASDTATCKITAARDGRLYRCIVTDSTGSTVTSEAAKVIVQTAAPLVITAQPQDYTGAIGESATFTVSATGDGLTYQWQYSDNGGETWTKSSAVSAVATCKITAARIGRLYRCIVTDAVGSSVTSDAAAVVLRSAIEITAQPRDFTGAVGATATFTVQAEGQDLTYQWQYSDNSGKSWTNSSAVTATATCKITAARDGRLYRCIITDADANTVTTDAAKVIVG